LASEKSQSRAAALQILARRKDTYQIDSSLSIIGQRLIEFEVLGSSGDQVGFNAAGSSDRCFEAVALQTHGKVASDLLGPASMLSALNSSHPSDIYTSAPIL